MNTIHKYIKDYTKRSLSVATRILPFIRSYKSRLYGRIRVFNILKAAPCTPYMQTINLETGMNL
jgi:hypothetical protein